MEWGFVHARYNEAFSFGYHIWKSDLKICESMGRAGETILCIFSGLHNAEVNLEPRNFCWHMRQPGTPIGMIRHQYFLPYPVNIIHP